VKSLSGIFSQGSLGVPGFTMTQALVSLLLAAIIGQFHAWVYILTHSGVSYSRAFVQSLVLLTIIVCMAMMVIGNNMIVAFGLIGALAVIRFRNVLKDTRDTAFIFFSLVSGIATGTGRFRIAILGAVLFAVVLFYLHITDFGSRLQSDAFLRFSLNGKPEGRDSVNSLLHQYCFSATLVSHRLSEMGSSELAYRLSLRDPARAFEMVERLRLAEGISNISFILQEEQNEI